MSSKTKQFYEKEYFSKHLPEYEGKNGLLKLQEGLNILEGESGAGKTVLAMRQTELSYWAINPDGTYQKDERGYGVPYFQEIVLCTLKQNTKQDWEYFFKTKFNRKMLAIPPSMLDQVYNEIETRHADARAARLPVMPKTLLIIDDIIGKENQDVTYIQNSAAMKEISSASRHDGVTCVYLSQSSIFVPLVAFTNAKYKAIFKFDTDNERKHLFNKVFGAREYVTHIKDAPKSVREEYFNREMDSLKTYQCIIVYKYITDPGTRQAKTIHKIYKYRV